jgi:hypothetical protein
VSDTLEVIEIKLAPEGSELSLLEKFPHNFLLELPRTVNHERAAMRKP